MSKNKTELLRIALDICDKEDRSMEYTMQYMGDYSGASFSEVLEYLLSLKENK